MSVLHNLNLFNIPFFHSPCHLSFLLDIVTVELHKHTTCLPSILRCPFLFLAPLGPPFFLTLKNTATHTDLSTVSIQICHKKYNTINGTIYKFLDLCRTCS